MRKRSKAQALDIGLGDYERRGHRRGLRRGGQKEEMSLRQSTEGSWGRLVGLGGSRAGYREYAGEPGAPHGWVWLHLSDRSTGLDQKGRHVSSCPTSCLLCLLLPASSLVWGLNGGSTVRRRTAPPQCPGSLGENTRKKSPSLNLSISTRSPQTGYYVSDSVELIKRRGSSGRHIQTCHP